jgi:DNA-binding XRE family transcriptional regulator
LQHQLNSASSLGPIIDELTTLEARYVDVIRRVTGISVRDTSDLTTNQRKKIRRAYSHWFRTVKSSKPPSARVGSYTYTYSREVITRLPDLLGRVGSALAVRSADSRRDQRLLSAFRSLPLVRNSSSWIRTNPIRTLQGIVSLSELLRSANQNHTSGGPTSSPTVAAAPQRATVCLGDRIRELRKEWGLSQNDLADEAKVDKTSLQDNEMHRTRPRGATLKKYADVFNKRGAAVRVSDLEDLPTGVPSKTPPKS